MVTISGSGFSSDLTVLVGSNPCDIVQAQYNSQVCITGTSVSVTVSS